MEITEKIYKDLFNTALFLNYQNEDRAAECVNHVILNLDRFNSDLSQFNTWSTNVMKNKKVTLWRKEKSYAEVILYVNDFELIEQQSAIDHTEDLIKRIEKKLSPQDYSWALEYISTLNSEIPKTNQQKLRFNQIKKKVIKEDKQPSIYIIDTITGSKRSFYSIVDAAAHLELTSEYIRQLIKSEALYKKKYRIYKKK